MSAIISSAQNAVFSVALPQTQTTHNNTLTDWTIIDDPDVLTLVVYTRGFALVNTTVTLADSGGLIDSFFITAGFLVFTMTPLQGAPLTPPSPGWDTGDNRYFADLTGAATSGVGHTQWSTDNLQWGGMIDQLKLGATSAANLPQNGALTTIGYDAQQANTGATYTARMARSSAQSTFTGLNAPRLLYTDPSDGPSATPWAARTFRNGDGSTVSEAQITSLGPITNP